MIFWMNYSLFALMFMALSLSIYTYVAAWQTKNDPKIREYKLSTERLDEALSGMRRMLFVGFLLLWWFWHGMTTC